MQGSSYSQTLIVDQAGNPLSDGAGHVPVVGSSPAGSAPVGNPLQNGGVVNTGAQNFANNVVEPLQLGQGGELLATLGGRLTAAVAAGVGTAAVVVKANPGRLCKITVTTLGTAALSFYDNAAAASGTVLFTIPASAAVGTIYDVQMPAAAGIVAGQVSNSPAVTVSYY